MGVVRIQSQVTFRFSGLRITVQDWPQWSICLLSELGYTPIDAGVRGCMRLGMRLKRCGAALGLTAGVAGFAGEDAASLGVRG